VKPHRI